MNSVLSCVISGIFATLLIATSYANDNSAKQKFLQSNLNKFSLDLIKARKARVPASPTDGILKLRATDELQSEKDTMPSSFWVPGEFNESQAAFISWPAYAYDSTGNYLEPFMDGMGWGWSDSSGHPYLATIDGYVLDLFEDSPYPPIWAKLADAIQHECVALIRVSAPDDTVHLKDYMAALGTPLYNYRFLTDPAGENAFWARDFSPYGFYYGAQDSLALLDAGYYPGRPIDDRLADFLGEQLGLKVFHSPLETEGGNFMTDGFGNVVMSDVIYENNMDNQGYAGKIVKPMTQAQVRDEIKRVFGAEKLNLLQHLTSDGGTGHIDIYLKMTDENTILTTKFPDSFNDPKFPDYSKANKNIQALTDSSKVYGKPLQFNKVVMPTYDDGSYPADSQTLNADDRGYVNGLLINKTFIYPSYHNSLSGNAAVDEQANEELKKYLPGYKLVPIDSRILTPMGGAIHCITMQIPASNPIRLSHKPLVGNISAADSISFAVNARNSHGVDSVILNYRFKGDVDWQTVVLKPADSEGNYSTTLDGDGLGTQTVEYYVEAYAKGKSESRPYTAPEGYYSFRRFDGNAARDYAEAKLTISPNPATYMARVSSPFAGLSNLIVTDIQGRKTFTSSGIGDFNIDCADLPEGVYFVKITNGNSVVVSKLVVIK